MKWRKSSRSNGAGGACVEVARAGRRTIAVRDSKNPDGGQLRVDAAEWRRFVQRLSR